MLKLASFGNKMRINWLLFREKLAHLPVFSLGDVRKFFPYLDRKRLFEWKEKGYIIQVSRGFYTWSYVSFTEQDYWAVACKIYSPAYISFESALSYYGLIPEAVFNITAISTQKTRIDPILGVPYTYRSLNPKLFWGYFVQQAPVGMPFCLVYPEKLLLDYLYFHEDIKNGDYFESLRWNKQLLHEIIKLDKLTRYKSFYTGKTFNQRLHMLEAWMYD